MAVSRGITRACRGPTSGRDGSRRAPREDEPEHVLVVGRPQEQQARHHRQRPDQVVEECPAAAPEREERVPPAVLQQEPGQRQPEREEGEPGRAREKRRHAQHDGAGRQAHDRGGPGTAANGTPPRRDIGAAEPDHQRVGGEAAGSVERERVGHVGEAEGAEVRRRQRAGGVDAHGRVGQAGHRLVGDAPAQAARDLAWPLPDHRPRSPVGPSDCPARWIRAFLLGPGSVNRYHGRRRCQAGSRRGPAISGSLAARSRRLAPGTGRRSSGAASRR